MLGQVFSYRDVTSRIRSEEQINKYIQRMEVLADAAKTFASARLDLPIVLKDISKWLAGYFQDGVLIRLFPTGDAGMKTAAFHHTSADVLHDLEEILKQGKEEVIDDFSNKEILRTGKAILITGSAKDIRSRIATAYLPFLDRHPVHCWISAPLRVVGQIIGLVSVFRFREAPVYSEEDKNFLQDLADRAALAIDNANLYTQAQRAIELRDDFISIASHELKTPLTPLKAYLQLLRDYCRNSDLRLDPKVAPLFKMIESSDQQIQRLAGLIEDMLDASSISSGHLPVNLEKVDLTELARQTIERFQSQSGQNKSEIQFFAKGSVVGLWDPSRLEQVVTNLISNAVKYGNNQPVHVSVSTSNGKAELKVRDFGLGVAPENQKRIFDRFERAVSIKRFGGLGLGLYIVRQIAKSHGGTVEVESELGRGSTFTVKIPQMQEQLIH